MIDDIKEILQICFYALLIVSILTVSFMALTGQLYPWYLSIQRKSVEQSKSFTDANNNMLQTYALEYSRLETKIAENPTVSTSYKAQQTAILNKMCLQVSTMAIGTIYPSNLS